MNKRTTKGLFVACLLAVFTLGFSNEFPECSSGLVDESASYYGNWDMHVGGCWTPPDPKTCVYCEYM